uniref:Uncharacterized protein n=1 Tax=Mus spicilegus TaxID=10103 RepID=A0A8C6GBS9_MUSSI
MAGKLALGEIAGFNQGKLKKTKIQNRITWQLKRPLNRKRGVNFPRSLGRFPHPTPSSLGPPHDKERIHRIN